MTLWPLSASGGHQKEASPKYGPRLKLLDDPRLASKPAAQLRSVPVGVGLEGASGLHTDVVGLLLREGRELGTERRQVQGCNLLVELLREQVDVVLVALLLRREQVDLREDLVRERARHHEGRVPGGAAEVEQPPGRQDDDAVAVWEDVAVHLRLDVLHLDAFELLQVVHLDLVIEVADVADDGIVLHLLHMLQRDDLEIACGSREDVDLADDALHHDHLEALHARLERTDGVNLSDQHPRTSTAHGERGTLAHITITTDERTLAPHHHVRGTHDAIWQRVPAPVDIVELGLGHAVVHIDGWKQELPLRGHLLQTVDTSGGLFADALALSCHAAVLRLVNLDRLLQELQDTLELCVVRGGRVWQGPVLGQFLLELLALVDQEGG